MSTEDQGTATQDPVTMEDLLRRIEALERENGRLRDEMASLRPAAHGSAHATVTDTAAEVSRRALLMRATALAAGSFAAGALVLRDAAPASAFHMVEDEYIAAGAINTHWLEARSGNQFAAIIGDHAGDLPGVEGRNNGPGPAVLGVAEHAGGTGVRGEGRYGVWGETSQAGFYGVLGRNLSTTSGGAGVRGVNEAGDGVLGIGKNGGSGVKGEGRAGVLGISGDWFGVWGQHTGSGPGVQGDSNTGPGVRGTSTNNDGVHGVGASDKTGVLGDGRYGVLGRTGDPAGIGVWGQHSGAGAAMVAHNFSSTSPAGPGIHAISDRGYGGQFEGGTAQLRLVPKGTTGRPSGAHQKGELYLDSTGALLICVRGGTPGRWRKVMTTAI